MSDTFHACFAHRLLAALLFLVSLAVAGPAMADSTVCTPLAAGGNITSTITISTPGHYCLGGNRTSTAAGIAIMITAVRVVIDCNGYTIANTGDTNAYAVLAQRNEVEISNCTFKDFRSGIVLQASYIPNGIRRARITNNNIVNARNMAIDARYTFDAFISGNRILDTTAENNASAAAFLVSAPGGVIVFSDNVVRGGTIEQAVLVDGDGRTLITGNRFEGIGNPSFQAQGVKVMSQPGATVPAIIRDNHMYLFNGSTNVAVYKYPGPGTNSSLCVNNVTPGTWAASPGCL